MKKILICIAVLLFSVGFAITRQAEAAFVFNLPYVFSPDSTLDQLISGNTIPNGTVITNVAFHTTGGSVNFGGGEGAHNFTSNPWPVGTSQPIGIYGMGFDLASLGNNIAIYKIQADGHFATYDDTSHDLFEAVITQGNYLWNGGTVMGGYTWGGSDRPGLETNNFNLTSIASVNVTPGSSYFLNIVLQTTGDTADPSWGRFSDVRVDGIVPEPASMSLLGLGLLGLVRKLRRK